MSFGIAGLVLALVAIFTTIGFNLVAIWIALACAAIAAASRRGFVLAVAVWFLCAGELLFNSQILGTLIGTAHRANADIVGVETASLYLTLAAFAAPILGLLLRRGSVTARDKGFVPSDGATQPSVASASDDAMEQRQSPAAPLQDDAGDSTSGARSTAVRLALFLALALGAAAVFFFLRSIDRAVPPEQSNSAHAQP